MFLFTIVFVIENQGGCYGWTYLSIYLSMQVVQEILSLQTSLLGFKGGRNICMSQSAVLPRFNSLPDSGGERCEQASKSRYEDFVCPFPLSMDSLVKNLVKDMDVVGWVHAKTGWTSLEDD